MTDVVTSVGILIGVGLVALTGLGTARCAGRLRRRREHHRHRHRAAAGVPLSGLLDKALPDEDHGEIITEVLRRRTDGTITFHGLQTREAGQQKYMNVHVLVPDEWTVKAGHDYIEGLEDELCDRLPDLTVLTHLEPISDPASYEEVPE